MNTSLRAQPMKPGGHCALPRVAYIAAFLLLGSVFLPEDDSFGQLTVAVNPAHTSDPRAVHINPAVPVAAAPRTYLGMKLIYPGVIDNNTFGLKSSLFNISSPQFTPRRLRYGILPSRAFPWPAANSGSRSKPLWG